MKEILEVFEFLFATAEFTDGRHCHHLHVNFTEGGKRNDSSADIPEHMRPHWHVCCFIALLPLDHLLSVPKAEKRRWRRKKNQLFLFTLRYGFFFFFLPEGDEIDCGNSEGSAGLDGHTKRNFWWQTTVNERLGEKRWNGDFKLAGLQKPEIENKTNCKGWQQQPGENHDASMATVYYMHKCIWKTFMFTYRNIQMLKNAQMHKKWLSGNIFFNSFNKITNK